MLRLTDLGLRGDRIEGRRRRHFKDVEPHRWRHPSKSQQSFGNIHNQQNIGCPVYRWALAEKTTFAPHRSQCSADIIEKENRIIYRHIFTEKKYINT